MIHLLCRKPMLPYIVGLCGNLQADKDARCRLHVIQQFHKQHFDANFVEDSSNASQIFLVIVNAGKRLGYMDSCQQAGQDMKQLLLLVTRPNKIWILP